MHKPIIVAALATSMLLAGCNTTGTIDLAALIAKVQETVSTVCAVGHLVVPTAQTIAEIYAKGDPNLQTAEQIAAALEAALCSQTPKATRGGPTVAGVQVKVLGGK